MENQPFEPRLIDALVREDRVQRRLFTDPAIFELEIEKIFHGTWVYVCHEAEIPQPGDFRRGRVGLDPVIVVRDNAGELNVLVNACRHRGVTVCQPERGHARHFACAYHGWTYDLRGNLAAVPFQEGQRAGFRRDDFGLIRLPRVESFAGFVFASFNAAVPPLIEHLGGAAPYLEAFSSCRRVDACRWTPASTSTATAATGNRRQRIPSTVTTPWPHTVRSWPRC